jgi:hypothetical protein
VLEVEVVVLGMVKVIRVGTQHLMVKSAMVEVVEVVIQTGLQVTGVEEEEEEALLVGVEEEALGEMDILVVALVNSGLVVVEGVVLQLALVVTLHGVEMEKLMVK